MPGFVSCYPEHEIGTGISIFPPNSARRTAGSAREATDHSRNHVTRTKIIHLEIFIKIIDVEVSKVFEKLSQLDV